MGKNEQSDKSAALTEITAARKALARAQDIYSVLEIRDVAKAAAVFAEAHDAGDAANEAKEVQLRAERKAGGFYAQMERGAGPGRGKKISQGGQSFSEYREALETTGTPQRTAHRWQKLAEIPDDKFEGYVEKKRGEGAELTQAGALRLAGQLHKPEPVETPALPDSKYRTIVIDPPWPVKKIQRDVRPHQNAHLDYPTMTIEEIESLPVGQLAYGEGCHLYLWVTQKYLPHGLQCVKLWGFRYQCLMTWVKPTGITPFSWMYNTEHVIFARMGNLKLNRLGIKLSFEAPVVKGTHSTKPDAFFENVAAASPGPRLEMFARSEREEFEAWGNEVESA